MFNALTTAGVKITEEGVLTLCKMIDEDGDGEIDQDEWRETIDFYLELKKEEAQMALSRKDSTGDLRANLRAKKLAELGQSARAVNKVNGLGMLRRRRATSVKSLTAEEGGVTIAVRKSQSSTCIKAVPLGSSILEHVEEEDDECKP